MVVVGDVLLLSACDGIMVLQQRHCQLKGSCAELPVCGLLRSVACGGEANPSASRGTMLPALDPVLRSCTSPQTS